MSKKTMITLKISPTSDHKGNEGVDKANSYNLFDHGVLLDLGVENKLSQPLRSMERKASHSMP